MQEDEAAVRADKVGPKYEDGPVPFAEVEASLRERVLSLPSAEEIHARLSNGDLFGLEASCGVRLRQRWILLDPTRAYEKTLAHVAIRAARGEKQRGTPEWFISCIDGAVDSLLTADREAVRAGYTSTPGEDLVHEHIATMFLIPLETARESSVRFNKLPSLQRRAFFDLIIDGVEPKEVLEKGYANKRELRLGVLRAIQAVGYLDDEEVERILNYGDQS